MSPEHTGRVPLARRVLDQSRVAGAEHVLPAVPQADLELPGEDDHELAARGRMPVEELSDRPDAERDLRGRQPLRPLPCSSQVDRLALRVPIGPRVKRNVPIAAPPLTP